MYLIALLSTKDSLTEALTVQFYAFNRICPAWNRIFSNCRICFWYSSALQSAPRFAFSAAALLRQATWSKPCTDLKRIYECPSIYTDYCTISSMYMSMKWAPPPDGLKALYCNTLMAFVRFLHTGFALLRDHLSQMSSPICQLRLLSSLIYQTMSKIM